MGDLKRVGAYFKNAGVELPAEHLMSCDTAGVGKPDPAAYKPVFEALSKDGSQPWFAAAHCKFHWVDFGGRRHLLTLYSMGCQCSQEEWLQGSILYYLRRRRVAKSVRQDGRGS